MRDIKFRAWAVVQQEWLPLSAEHLGSSVRDDKDAYVFTINSDKDILIWCQATGLKDNNGTPIYEGDIVRQYSGDRYRKYLTREVKWTANSMYTGWNIGSKGSFEVIGNIYENKELLK